MLACTFSAVALNGNSVPIWTTPHEAILDVRVNWSDLGQGTADKVATLINLLLTCVDAMVEHEPQNIILKAEANHRRVGFTLRVPDNDMGLVLGHKGTNANAIRLLLIAACRKLDFRYDLDITSPSGERDWSSD